MLADLISKKMPICDLQFSDMQFSDIERFVPCHQVLLYETVNVNIILSFLYETAANKLKFILSY